MSPGFKYRSKFRTSYCIYHFLYLTWHIQVDIGRSYGRFIQESTKSEKINFKEKIKIPIFIEPVLAIETMHKSQSILVEIANQKILRIYFSSKTDQPIFKSIAPKLCEWSNKKSSAFSALKSKSFPNCNCCN